MKMNRWLRLSLQLLGLLLFGLLIWWTGIDNLRQLLEGDWRWLIISGLLTGAAQALSASRLLRMARAVEKRPVATWRTFYWITMSSQLMGLVLPRGVSAVGGKAVGLRTVGVPVGHAVWIVLLDNLCDVILLSIASVSGFLFISGWINTTTFFFVLIGTMAGATWLIGWLTAEGKWHTYLRPIKRWSKLHQKAQEGLALLPAQATLTHVLSLTMGINLLLALRFFAISNALRVPASAWLFVAIFPMAQLSLIFAFAPGGLGIFELGWVGLLQLGNYGSEVANSGIATTFAVAQRAYTTVYNLFWGGVSYLIWLTIPSNKRNLPAEETLDTV